MRPLFAVGYNAAGLEQALLATDGDAMSCESAIYNPFYRDWIARGVIYQDARSVFHYQFGDARPPGQPNAGEQLSAANNGPVFFSLAKTGAGGLIFAYCGKSLLERLMSPCTTDTIADAQKHGSLLTPRFAPRTILAAWDRVRVRFYQPRNPLEVPSLSL